MSFKLDRTTDRYNEHLNVTSQLKAASDNTKVPTICWLLNVIKLHKSLGSFLLPVNPLPLMSKFYYLVLLLLLKLQLLTSVIKVIKIHLQLLLGC